MLRKRATANLISMPPPYERLQAWNASHELVLAIYRVTRSFPSDERYGLTSQLRRAALSVPNNIAEGAAKRGSREFRRFLDIALGSLSEVTYLLRVAHDLRFLSDEAWSRVESTRDHAGKLTWRLYQAHSRRC